MPDLPPPGTVRQPTGLREMRDKLRRLDAAVKKLQAENEQLKAQMNALGGP